MWPLVIGVSLGTVATLGVLFWYACTVPSSQVFGPALVRGPAQGWRITLTLDDGPTPFTEQVLDILHDRQVTATFFVCGENVQRFPEILQRAHADGHTIGNHTFSHLSLIFCSRARMAEEIDRAQELIRDVSGVRPRLFRPPNGLRWFGISSVLRERGMHLVQWSDTGYDWRNGAEAVVRDTLRDLGPGSVILLHDGRRVDLPEMIDCSNTVAALPRIIDGARKAGFTFVPIEDFLAEANRGRI